MLRAGDLAGHDSGSDVFAIIMTAPSRLARAPAPVDIRAALERVAAEIRLRSRLRVDSGWTLLARLEPHRDLSEEIAGALERGARERERYDFFSTAGHELRTPLASIRGYLETLLDGDLDGATMRRFLGTARRETLRMERLIEGMFQFSLLDLSGESAAHQSSDVPCELAQACDVMRPAAQARGMTVEIESAPEASAAIDPDACQQLLVNLLDNAVKYGRDGGTIRVGGRLCGSDVILAVDDDGPGIAEDEHDSIFALRVRGSNAGARPGTGIGLAIVKMIAERAGGSVNVTRSPLGGARFEATLRVKEDFHAPAS
jgi:two-component system phosphate regulon sensor histidine kinase PhoR